MRVVATPINELIYCYGYYFLFGTDQFIFFLPKKDKRITILIFFLLIYNVVILLEDDMKCIPLHEVIIRARAS